MKDFNSLEELEEYLNKVEEEIKDLRENIRTRKEKHKEWELKIGEEFYTISGFGYVNCWEYKGDVKDLNAFRTGSAFKTKEEAEFEVEKRKVIAELNRYSKAHNPGENNFCIYYSYEEDALVPYLEPLDEPDIGAYYFESEKMAKKAIKEVGEERIKKYLFGVEE